MFWRRITRAFNINIVGIRNAIVIVIDNIEDTVTILIFLIVRNTIIVIIAVNIIMNTIAVLVLIVRNTIIVIIAI